MAGQESEKEEKSGVAAVDRAVSIVSALAGDNGRMSLSELSRATGLYKSTILRLLESLEKAQFVTRLQEGQYTLGPMASRLGMAYDRLNDISVHILPVLDELVANGTESASFHVPYSDSERLCLLRKDSGHSTLDSVRAGQVLPLKGAAGKVVGMFTTSNVREALKNNPLIESRGERDPSCGGLASPIVGANLRFIGALSLSGPIIRFTPKHVAEMKPLLLDAARRLSLRFGGSFDLSVVDNPNEQHKNAVAQVRNV